MNIQIVAFVFGCLLLFVAILGGGFEVKELKVPKVGRASRLASCVIGMLFVVLGFSPAFAEVLPKLLATVPAAQPQPAAAPSSQAPQPDLRPTTEAARQVRSMTEPPRQSVVSKTAKPRKSTTAAPETGRVSLRDRIRNKWHRVKSSIW